ncbi:SLC13/DASS family transporter, partial [Xanthomonas citri pv. citri]|nr:SLC13/DASS family transporter [Xanthomonas citri pv. citri]
IKVSFSEWLAYGMPVAILLMISMVIALLAVLRPNFNVPFEAKVENIPLTPKRLTTLIVFCVTAVLLTFSSAIEPIVRQVLELKESIKSFDA